MIYDAKGGCTGHCGVERQRGLQVLRGMPGCEVRKRRGCPRRSLPHPARQGSSGSGSTTLSNNEPADVELPSPWLASSSAPARHLLMDRLLQQP